MRSSRKRRVRCLVSSAGDNSAATTFFLNRYAAERQHQPMPVLLYNILVHCNSFVLSVCHKCVLDTCRTLFVWWSLFKTHQVTHDTLWRMQKALMLLELCLRHWQKRGKWSLPCCSNLKIGQPCSAFHQINLRVCKQFLTVFLESFNN